MECSASGTVRFRRPSSYHQLILKKREREGTFPLPFVQLTRFTSINGNMEKGVRVRVVRKIQKKGRGWREEDDDDDDEREKGRRKNVSHSCFLVVCSC